MMAWNLTFDFGIDEGELGEATRERAFVLGTEMGRFLELVKNGAGFVIDAHRENLDRIQRLLWSLERQNAVRQSHDDWVTIVVTSTGSPI